MKKKFPCLVILLLVANLSYTVLCQSVTASGWLGGWNYRQSHVIKSAFGAGTDYQMRIKAIYDSSFCEQGDMALGLGSFEGSDVDSDGNIYVGYQYKIYKSTDNGETFSLIHTIPTQSNPQPDYAGRVWCVFIDSRDYVFVSAGSTNRLYRSMDGGESFGEVLNMNRALNDGQIANIAEDENGHLYGAEFCATGYSLNPRLWKSTDGGVNWSAVKSWSVGHLHGVYFNSFNDFLYVLTGETIGSERDRVYRSKNGGSDWQILVDTQSIDVPYLACDFIDDYVYLGQDKYTATCNIHCFQDDGVSESFTPATVFINPYDRTPWFSATRVGDYLAFAGCRDVDNGNALIVRSLNGIDWEIVMTCSVDSGDRLLGQLTKHSRKGQAFITIHKTASTYLTSTSFLDIVGLSQKCRTDFGDVRFTESDGTTLLDYWVEEKTDSNEAIFWVEVADDLSSEDHAIYVYYGKDDATSISSGQNTFLFFDDFLGSAWDTSAWQTVGSPSTSVSDSKIVVSRNSYSGSWSAHGLKTKTFSVDEARIMTRAKTSSTHASNTAGYACSQFTSKGARNGFGFSGGNIIVEVDGRDEGASFTTAYPQAYLTNAFYTLYLYRWGTSYAKEYVNGVYKSQVTSNVRDGSRNVAVWIEEWGSFSGTRDVTVDWVAVAKYADPEPSHGNWGSEEIGNYIIIDQAFWSDERADIGSVQTIGFCIRWSNGSNVDEGSIYLNGTEYVTNSTGWINLNVFSSKVGKDTWTVTGVNCSGVRTYVQTCQNPSIIWDRIEIFDGGVSNGLPDLGESITIWFKALYEYDKGIFNRANGVLYLDGSAMIWSTTNNRWEFDYVANNTGTKAFVVSEVSDRSYDLAVIDDTVGAQSASISYSPFSVNSNSTISELAFNSTSKTLIFTVDGPSGTIGYTNVTIAKTLIEDISQLEVYVDGEPINYVASATDYYWRLRFTYNHSKHNVALVFNAKQTESRIATPFDSVHALILIGVVITIVAAILSGIKKRRPYPIKTNYGSNYEAA
jgi:hypothetical protein